MIKLQVPNRRIRNYGRVTISDAPSFSGIVAGECKGDLWVDDPDCPSIAIAYSYEVGSLAFLGAVESDEALHQVKAFVYDEIFPWLGSQGMGSMEFSVESEGLREAVLSMFRDRELQREREFRYRYAADKRNSLTEQLVLPEGFMLAQVDHRLKDSILEGSVENGLPLLERILESWDSFEQFVERSSAFCVMHHSRMIAFIMGSARFEDVLTISIETEEAHRNKGLGLLLTASFVKECLSRGLTPQWDCVESNPASRRLAEKAGFAFFKENEVYWFKM